MSRNESGSACSLAVLQSRGVDPDRWYWPTRSVVWSCASFEPFDDDHTAAAAGAGMIRLRFGWIGAACFDGINRNNWRHEQLAGAGDILGALSGGEQAVVADAVEPCWQHVDQETANELVDGEGHHFVALGTFDPVVLPLEGDAFLVACDQAAIGDGNAVGVARKITQHFLWAAEWSLAVDHPFAVTQRCQE